MNEKFMSWTKWIKMYEWEVKELYIINGRNIQK